MEDINFKQKEYIQTNINEVCFSSKEIIDTKFYDCVFKKCDFNETSFTACRFSECTFEDCNLSLIKVKNCTVSSTKFINSKLVGVNWTKVKWPSIKLSCPLEFINCVINYSTFIGLNLNGLVLKKCLAKNVDFRDANLRGGDFTYTDFVDSLFINTNLTEVDFSYAKNYMIDIINNKIKNAKFTLPEAMNLLYGLDINIVE